jgi:hypothetical protein
VKPTHSVGEMQSLSATIKHILSSTVYNTLRTLLHFKAVVLRLGFAEPQGSTEHRLGFRQKEWNIYTTIFKYRKILQIYHEISREFLSGNCKYWSNLRALTAVSLYIYRYVCVCVCFRFHRQGFLRGKKSEMFGICPCWKKLLLLVVASQWEPVSQCSY